MPNLKLAVRTLSRTPFVTGVAIASLALGIGANTAIFSLIQRVLRRPLPVPQPEQLVNLAAIGPKSGSTSCNNAGDCDVIFSYPMFRDLEKGQTVLTGLAAHRLFPINVSYQGKAEDGEGMLASGSYFPVLGIQPALGRLLGPSDDETRGANFVAVLSYSYWQNQLGADPRVLDQSIIINGRTMTIVGVAPDGFEGTTLGSRPKVFVPISMRAEMTPGFQAFDNRRSYWVYLFGRLKPGVSIDQARDQINRVYHPIVTDVELPLQVGVSEQFLAGFKTKQVKVEAGHRGQNNIQAQATTPLAMLFAVTAIVLLIACTNVANLLLARAATRSTEMAVRSSLGASRGQLVAQLLAESMILALVAGGLSLVVARLTLRLIGSFMPSEALRLIDFQINPSTLLFASALSIGTALVFGLLPALQSTRTDLVSMIKSNPGKGSAGRGATRFRTGLVTAQIGLSMALLCSAGLFIRSMVNVSRVDLGVRTDSVVVFSLSPELNGYQSGQIRTLFRRIEEDLAGLPGVTAVTAGMVPLLSGSNWSTDVRVEGFKSTPETDNNSRLNLIGPGYFKTLGMPVLLGRELTMADDAGGPKVALINEAFAKKFNLGNNPIGKRMSDGGEQLDMEIVGLVKNAAYSEVKGAPAAVFFTPYRQDTTIGTLVFYVRTAAAPTAIVRAIPGVVAKLDPTLPVSDLKTLPQQVKENIFLDRMISSFSTAFALLATLLAAVGLYGVLAYAVAQRTREIGVRMALGANAGNVRTMVLKQVGLMTVVGGTLGMVAALGLSRAARSLLFGLEGSDPLAFAGAAAVLTLVALGAGYVPALRASRVHPMQALRYE